MSDQRAGLQVPKVLPVRAQVAIDALLAINASILPKPGAWPGFGRSFIWLHIQLIFVQSLIIQVGFKCVEIKDIITRMQIYNKFPDTKN